jgi:phosphatidylglycerol:prolipoprotein diacylglycerol transferase
MLALFLTLYALFRFLIEFFREPDAHLGYLALGLSMGQLLCQLMAVAGGLLWRQRKTAPAQTKPGQQRRSSQKR